MIRNLKIGSLTLPTNLILAPMAGVTNLPMRIISREQGASLCFTEMVSVNGLVREGKKSFDLVRSTLEDRPLGIQIFGDDPIVMAEGARLVEPYGDLIDINMGCPVRKVISSGAGSALLREPDRIRAILREVRRATRLPLTIKIRAGWSAEEENYLEIGRIAEEEGCDAITLHPRSRAQMFDGQADRSKIAALKRALTIPVIASGDMFTAADIASTLAETGCDGVMVARGALGNPWIFREALQLAAGKEAGTPSQAERFAVALRHLQLFIESEGERVAVREMRKHFSWYAHGVPGAARFRSLVNGLVTSQEMIAALREFFGETGH
ncbi:MAG: tRNA dihydrouridine synthase DusB [Geobacter sp.]|nr:tRNA dihydrouridine synthase DusB [Geobacter sp.]